MSKSPGLKPYATINSLNTGPLPESYRQNYDAIRWDKPNDKPPQDEHHNWPEKQEQSKTP